jgi:hypothetical protein
MARPREGSVTERPIGLEAAERRVSRATFSSACEPLLELALGFVEHSIHRGVGVLGMMRRVVAHDELMPREADVDGRMVAIAMAMVVA